MVSIGEWQILHLCLSELKIVKIVLASDNYLGTLVHILTMRKNYCLRNVTNI